MNTKYTLLGVVTLGVVTFLSLSVLSPLSHAKEKSEAPIDVKCFVDLYGGGQTIYFARMSKELYKSLPVTLVNEKVYTKDRDSKKQVYAVKECTLEKNLFKSAIANNIESTMTK
ncbi:hypothetical protein ACOYR1_04490 [Thalassotalea piscium]